MGYFHNVKISQIDQKMCEPYKLFSFCVLCFETAKFRKFKPLKIVQKIHGST